VRDINVVMAEITGEAHRAHGQHIRMVMSEVFVMRDAKISERPAYVIELKENDFK
jgi:ketosteroid isomerase-like protein